MSPRDGNRKKIAWLALFHVEGHYSLVNDHPHSMTIIVHVTIRATPKFAVIGRDWMCAAGNACAVGAGDRDLRE
jgi:hypothetical protein